MTHVYPSIAFSVTSVGSFLSLCIKQCLGVMTLIVSTTTVEVGGTGIIYASQIPTSTIERFNSAGLPMGTFASVSNPQGLVIDPQGNLFVSDSGTGTVQWFNSNGLPLGTFATVGNPGDLAIDSVENLYVSNFVPEPSSLILMKISIGFIICNYRRRQP
jgi:DNA-binding beta-propeller fold protein YncE